MIRLAKPLCLLLSLLLPPALHAAETPEPLLIGLDGEFGMLNSTSAQAIERGARIAIAEINEQGGVLGGRRLELVTRDNRSVPARGVENIRQFAAMDNLVAVLGGRFSPVILEELPLIHQLKVPLLAAWSSADPITAHDYQPSYTFRLSLRDSYAMPVMLDYARSLGAGKIGLLVPNTGWGRSNAAAAQHYASDHGEIQLIGPSWYNWGEKDMLRFYTEMKLQGAEAIVLVANDIEGSELIRQIAAAGPEHPLPIIAHWGVTGGHFVEQCGPALNAVDLSVVQTFSLFRAEAGIRKRVMARARELFGIERIEEVDSPVGFGHAYDLVQILARAIELAGSGDRTAIRDALERVSDYHGLTGDYPHPFTAKRHDALRPEQVFMARYRRDGVVVPIDSRDAPAANAH